MLNNISHTKKHPAVVFKVNPRTELATYKEVFSSRYQYKTVDLKPENYDKWNMFDSHYSALSIFLQVYEDFRFELSYRKALGELLSNEDDITLKFLNNS
ncbi:MAG: hypothetical protein P9X22_02915, partial [Candidatus Zapsychrus exili]|nr:hypothetical protein [Candidatus Zapsychrus exili]